MKTKSLLFLPLLALSSAFLTGCVGYTHTTYRRDGFEGSIVEDNHEVHLIGHGPVFDTESRRPPIYSVATIPAGAPSYGVSPAYRTGFALSSYPIYTQAPAGYTYWRSYPSAAYRIRTSTGYYRYQGQMRVYRHSSRPPIIVCPSLRLPPHR